jgi:tryptophan halogenase
MSEVVRTMAIRNIVIVGGGLAGWYCAARLCHAMRGRAIQVRVVHAAPRGAEADPLDVFCNSGQPSQVLAHAGLGIDERDFMRAANAAFKLATEFRDFGTPGSVWMLPFGEIGARLEAVGFHQFIGRMLLAGRSARLDEFSVPAIAARLGRFAHPSQDERTVLSTYEYGYQLDAFAYTRFLREFAQRLGAQAVDGELAEVTCSEDGKNVAALILGDGSRITADLYIDCSGVRAELLGRALRVPFDSWSQWLPCDHAAVMRSPFTGATPPFSQVTAQPHGWISQTAHRGAVDHALVFRSSTLESAAADAQVKTLGPAAAAPRVLSFVNGRHRELWRGNCIALGNAAGFLEPLADTGLRLLEDGVARLIALFPDSDSAPLMAAEFNRRMGAAYDGARDFVLLHRLPGVGLPPSLAQRLELFRYRGRVVLHDDEIFEEADWACAFIGLGERPAHHSILAGQLGEDEMLAQIAKVTRVMQAAAQKLPPHQAYLERYLA